MQGNKEKISQAVLVTEAIILVLLFFLLHLPVLDIIKLFLFTLVQIVGVGYFLTQKWNPVSSEEKIALILGTGISFSIISYFLAMFLSQRWVYFLLPFVIGALGLVQLGKRIFMTHIKLKVPVSYSVLIFLFAMLILSVLGRSFASLPVQIAGYTEIYKDTQWIIGNTNSLLISFPPGDIRFAGLEFNYHYFSSVFMAVVSAVTGITADYVMLYYVQLFTIPAIFFSIVALGKRFFDSEKKTLFFVFALFFTESAGLLTKFIGHGSGYYNIFLRNLLYLPNGIDFGTIFLVLTVIVTVDLLSQRNQRGLSYALLAMFTAVTMGSKGPYGMTILAMGAGMLLISLLKKEKVWQNVFNFLAILAGFLPVYFGLLAPSANETYLISFAPGIIPQMSSIGWLCGWYFQQAIDFVLNVLPLPQAVEIGISKVCYCVCMVVVHYLGYLFFVSIPCICLLFSQLRNFKKTEISFYVLWGIAGSALVAGYLFDATDYGQIYFFLAATPFLMLLGCHWIFSRVPKAKKIEKCLIVFTFVIASLSAVQTHYQRVHSVVPNVIKCAEAYFIQDVAQVEPADNILTQKEYEGLAWIRDNTPQEAVCATDRHFPALDYELSFKSGASNAAHYFYHSAVAARQMFIEAWAYTPRTTEMSDRAQERYIVNSQLYAPDTQNRVQLMQQNGIDYIIVSAYVNPGLRFTDYGLILLFENSDIAVYGISP